MIHERHAHIPLTTNHILQLHEEMLKYTGLSCGGCFKNVPNEICSVNSDESKEVIFKPLEPFETPLAVVRICTEYRNALAKEIADPLILIPVFILDFLSIHPFNEGNGRMSRLLTLLLLYKSGFNVGKYISIEKAINDTKEDYYNVLALSDKAWHTGENDNKQALYQIYASDHSFLLS